MDTIKRAVHIDFHTMPGIYDFGSGWDAKEFAATLKKAHVTYVNAFAQCNTGYAYYPTKVGIPYPGMKGDMFGSLLEECHRVGIKVSAYFNAGLNMEQAIRHPDWCYMSKDGSLFHGDLTGPGSRGMCYHTPYRDYLLSFVQELLDRYEVDGLFSDCMFLTPCYCPSCVRKMRQQGVDPEDDAAVLVFANQTRLEMGRDLRSLIAPNQHLFCNCLPFYDAKDISDHIEIECLPSGEGGWGYDYFAPSMAYCRNINDQVLYMTGRFQVNWGDFGGLKPKASIENDLYDAISNGAQISVGDHMHPAQNLDPEIYGIVEQLYQKFEQYEPWTDRAKYLPEIGVVTNLDELSLPDRNKGVSQLLGQLHYQYDIVNEEMDLSPFSLLILPDEIRMTQRLAEKLEAHLAAGKKLLSTGFSGLNSSGSAFALSVYDDLLEFCGRDQSNASYFRFCDPLMPQMPVSLYLHGILMKAVKEDDCVASYIKPYFSRHWDGIYSFSYTPPEAETGHAVAVSNGSVCHICFPLFTAYYQKALKAQKDLLSNILRQMIPQPLIQADAFPSTSRVTLTGCDEFTLVHVKATHPEPRGCLNVIEEHSYLPEGLELSILGEYRSVALIPEGTSIPSRIYQGRTIFSTPGITGFQSFVLTP